MRKRIHLKRKIGRHHTVRPKNILIITLVILILCIIGFFRFFSKKATPLLVNYAEVEAQKFASVVVNKAIAKDISSLNTDDLFIISKGNNGEINSIDFNPVHVNTLLATLTESVQKNLRYIEQGKLDKLDLSDDFFLNYDREKLSQGIIYEVPFGIVLNNSFLSNLGPYIPVRLDLIGDIVSNVKTNITNYGINNALIEISVNIEINEQVILPFASKKITLTTNVPVAMKLMQGTVPKYYMNGLTENSPIFSIPVE